MNYKLIIVTADERTGKLLGWVLNPDGWRTVDKILDEVKTTEYDFDTDEEYEEFVENSSYITGEVTVIDEDGNEYTDYPPCFAVEDYAGYALFEGDELTEVDTVDDSARYFLEEHFNISAA